jgi:hypothetical protein
MAAKKGHERGTAHEFTPEEARVAGRKGGLARAQNRSRNGDEGRGNNESSSGMSETSMAGESSMQGDSVRHGQ